MRTKAAEVAQAAVGAVKGARVLVLRTNGRHLSRGMTYQIAFFNY